VWDDRSHLSAETRAGNLPGPLAAALIARDEQVTSPSYTRPYPLAVRRAQGCWVEDLDGRRYLDFTAGIAVCSTGHCHPRVVAAIQRQAGELLHMCAADFYYPVLADLAEKLAAIAPGTAAKRVLFTNSGTEAIEAAIKLARFATGRPALIAFHGAFHGRTLGSLSLTASKAVQRAGFGPFIPGVYHVPFADPFRGPRDSAGDCTGASLAALDRLFRTTVPPADVAAVVVEPIQGEGGYIVPPADFHRRLAAMCRRHGILYVADEVQTGMGRTGRLWASQHWGVEPDILCTAKGLASGLPLGAIVARADLMTWPPGAHASTFGGNPLACAAALETIALVEEELADNAARKGELLLDALRAPASKHPAIGDVRGLGLMLAVDLVRDRATKEPNPQRRDAVIQEAFRRGLLLLGCGASAIRLCPPLVVSGEECRQAVETLDAALAAVE
jgi:4-aminobutyrate aminotransferase